MAQFINAKETLVNEAIDGMLRAGAGWLTRLDGYPHIKVVTRADWDKSKVALISGGGSGHEPAHAGFVGQGMLTAAVCGQVFASPSVDAVLAAILAVTGEAGCLLIVKNYTGDRLNFGLAAERARALGLKVLMVIVDDDIALPDLPQSRGVAGTLFVHKIAGALAEQGADLKAIAAAAAKIISGIISIGMSLDTCTVPGSKKEDRIAPGQAELGLGIHGEPGVEQLPFTDAAGAMRLVIDRLTPHISVGPQAVLLNNLGGTTPLEMSVLANELAHSRLGLRLQWMIGPAPLMTSLDMRGFSISLLPVDAERVELLRTNVAPRAWPGCHSFTDAQLLPLPHRFAMDSYTPSMDPAVHNLIETCCNALIAAEKKLNQLDAKSGDGDTGSTLASAARELKAKRDSLPMADKGELCQALSRQLSETMGGSSGVLLAIFFAATGDALGDGANLIEALKAGLQRISQVGGAALNDRTMIDALAPALDAMPDGLDAAALAARSGADHTQNIPSARAGRASYVSASNLKGNNDPGAEAVAILFESLS